MSNNTKTQNIESNLDGHISGHVEDILKTIRIVTRDVEDYRKMTPVSQKNIKKLILKGVLKQIKDEVEASI